MKKSDMIYVDPKLITSENEQLYREYYITIFETIKETYCFLYYLEGAEQLLGQYKKIGKSFEFFVSDLLRLLKQKICLNICKLVLDEGPNVLTVNALHLFIIDNFNHIVREKIKVPNDLRKKIIDMRDHFIGHNLHTEKSFTITMNELKPILDNVFCYFQKHWIKNFVNDNFYVADDYFVNLKPFYVDAICEALKAVRI